MANHRHRWYLWVGPKHEWGYCSWCGKRRMRKNIKGPVLISEEAQAQ